VRGIIAFLQTTEQDLKDTSTGPSASQVKQNKMMMNRILFQALAIIIVVLLLAMSRG
jgi:Hypoxia induced protein conserved region